MRSRRFSTGARGVELQLCEWGEGDPPTIILHGYLEQGPAWDAVASRIEGRVIAPAHRGHGRSEHVGSGGFYHFFDYVADLDALVEDLSGPVRIIGHSMGGTIAGYYAGACPDRVSALVLVEGLGPPDRSDDPVGVARQHLKDRREPRQHPVFDNIDEAVNRLRRMNAALDRTSAIQLAKNLVKPTPEGKLRWSWDTLHRARNARPFDPSVFMAFLREITAPTLLVNGAESKFLPADYLERRRSLPHAREVVLPGAGHLVHHDTPILLAETINSFFNAHPRN